MRLIITRHGETEENKAGILQGHLHGTLSDLGKEQAGKLAERLRGEKIDLIVSSDLDRAHDTAKAVAKFHPDVDLTLDKRLRERFLGGFQGKRKEEDLGINKDRLIADVLQGDGVETSEELYSRAGDLLNSVTDLDSQNVLLVGHNGICKNILRNIMRPENHDDVPGLKNTSVSIFEIDEDKNFNEVLLNDVGHLE